MALRVEIDVSGVVRAQKTIDRSANAMKRQFRALNNSTLLVEKAIKDLQRSFSKSTTTMRQDVKKLSTVTQSGFKKTENSFITLGKTVKATAAIYAAMKLADFAKETVTATMAVDSLQRTFEAITGSATAAHKELEFLQKTASTLGFNLTDLESGYKGILAASKGTVLEGQKTRDIFTAIAKAGAVLGMTSEDMQGSLKAIMQMMSKGKVTAEELRQQLGDRLPGAIQLAAEAMGIGTKELDKMMEQGKLLSNEFIPQFAAALENRVGAAAEKAGARTSASVARMKNAFIALQRALATSGVDFAIRNISDGIAAVVTQITGSIVYFETFARAIFTTVTQPIIILKDKVYTALKTIFDSKNVKEVFKNVNKLVFKLFTAIPKAILSVLVSSFKSVSKIVAAIGTEVQDFFVFVAQGGAKAAKVLLDVLIPGKSSKESLDALKQLNTEYLADVKQRMKKHSTDIQSFFIERAARGTKIWADAWKAAQPPEIVDAPKVKKAPKEFNYVDDKFFDLRKGKAELSDAFKIKLKTQLNKIIDEGNKAEKALQHLQDSGVIKTKKMLELERQLRLAIDARAIALAQHERVFNDSSSKQLSNTTKNITALVREIDVHKQLAEVQESGITAYIKSLEESVTVQQMFTDLTVNSFQAMGDSLSEFIKTGKMDFKSFANTVIDELVRMFVQSQIVLPLVKGLFGADGKGGGWIDKGLSALLGGLSAFSTGGVVTGKNITKASNSIVSTPTYFSNITPAVEKFATGGIVVNKNIAKASNSIIAAPTFFPSASSDVTPFAIGGALVGEAGRPEGILPLTRVGADLGVKADFSGSSPAIVNINVENNASDKVNAEVTSSTDSIGNTVIGIVIDAALHNKGGFSSVIQGVANRR